MMGNWTIGYCFDDEIHFSIFFQVDEAIAVLQAHRVKECSKD